MMDREIGHGNIEKNKKQYLPDINRYGLIVNIITGLNQYS
jgi:hypothetical protein